MPAPLARTVVGVLLDALAAHRGAPPALLSHLTQVAFTPGAPVSDTVRTALLTNPATPVTALDRALATWADDLGLPTPDPVTDHEHIPVALTTLAPALPTQTWPTLLATFPGHRTALAQALLDAPRVATPATLQVLVADPSLPTSIRARAATALLTCGTPPRSALAHIAALIADHPRVGPRLAPHATGHSALIDAATRGAPHPASRAAVDAALYLGPDGIDLALARGGRQRDRVALALLAGDRGDRAASMLTRHVTLAPWTRSMAALVALRAHPRPDRVLAATITTALLPDPACHPDLLGTFAAMAGHDDLGPALLVSAPRPEHVTDVLRDLRRGHPLTAWLACHPGIDPADRDRARARLTGAPNDLPYADQLAAAGNLLPDLAAAGRALPVPAIDAAPGPALAPLITAALDGLLTGVSTAGTAAAVTSLSRQFAGTLEELFTAATGVTR